MVLGESVWKYTRKKSKTEARGSSALSEQAEKQNCTRGDLADMS